MNNNDDKCGMLMKYKTIRLKSPSIITYEFEDDKNIFNVEYDSKQRAAFVINVQCKRNNNCIPFTHDRDKRRQISGVWTESYLEIELVYLGNAAKQGKGNGICTRAVSYLLKVLLIESAKMSHFPYRGKVHVSSMYPCAAGNCYKHAFENNGFIPDKDELEEFVEKNNSNRGKYLDFKFTQFVSVEQAKLYKEKTSRLLKRAKGRRKQKDKDLIRILERDEEKVRTLWRKKLLESRKKKRFQQQIKF